MSYQFLSSERLFLSIRHLLIQPVLSPHSPSEIEPLFDVLFVSFYWFQLSVLYVMLYVMFIAGVLCPKPVSTCLKRCAPCWPNRITTSSASATVRKPAAYSETASTSGRTATPAIQTRYISVCEISAGLCVLCFGQGCSALQLHCMCLNCAMFLQCNTELRRSAFITHTRFFSFNKTLNSVCRILCVSFRKA